MDASGQSSKTPQWLAHLGFEAPPETVVDAGLGYATRWYRVPEGFDRDWKSLAVLPKWPEEPRGGSLRRVEGDRWTAVLIGIGEKHQPPTDPEAFLEFARSLPGRLRAHRSCDPDHPSLVGARRCPTIHWSSARRAPPRARGGARAAQAANLFDLRRIIGGVFGVWGVLLIILGITDSDAEIAKAADVNINLWTGLGMLVISAIFVTWALTRPLGEELAESEEDGGGTGPDVADAGGGDDPRPQ